MCPELIILLFIILLIALAFMVFILIEGMISKRCLKLTDKQTFPVVIIANISSTIVAAVLIIGYFPITDYLIKCGCGWIHSIFQYLFFDDLFEYYTPFYFIQFPALLVILFLPAYLLSVLIESLSCSSGWKKYGKTYQIRKVIWLANAVSYSALIIIYSALFCVYYSNYNVREYDLSGCLGPSLMRGIISANSNSPAPIKQEISSSLFKTQIATTIDVDESVMSNITVYVTKRYDFMEDLYPGIIGARVSKKIYDAIDLYVSLRIKGHTPKYAFASLKQKYHPVFVSHTDGRYVVLSEYPDVPVDWLITNPKMNPQLRAEGYNGFVVIDGEVAWRYEFKMKSDGSLEYCYEEKRDSIEYNPQLKFIYDDACEEAEYQLELAGKAGQLGSCHLYWEYLQSILKEDYDISWKSPPELNPGTCYD